MAKSTFCESTILIPGPSFHVDLAPLDALHPVHYSGRVLIFRCSSSSQRDAQLAAFKAGLQALVRRCPILGGLVVPLPPDEAVHGLEDWRTIVPDRGIELIVKDLRKVISYQELRAAEFSPSHLPYDLLVPSPEGLGNDRPFAACKMQFTAIEGGTILTWDMSHSVADGQATNELMRILSEETQLAQKSSLDPGAHNVSSPAETTVLGLDRSILRNQSSQIPFDIEQHPAYMLKTDASTNGPSSEQALTRHLEATAREVPVLLHISAAGLAQLKEDATTPNAPPISTHDALSALIWRTLLLIRTRRSASSQNIPDSTMTNLFLPSDARRHLNLPASYIGNAVYQLIANLELGSLLSPSGLQHAASALRHAITSVDHDLVSSYMTMLKERWVDWQFMNGTLSTTGVAMGTDWTSSALYRQDWGEAFGPLIRFRYPADAFNCVLPKLPDDGAEIVVGVMPEEFAMLKGVEGFGKYLVI